MIFTGRYVPVPATGTVSAGAGTVWEKHTRGIPVWNPTQDTNVTLLEKCRGISSSPVIINKSDPSMQEMVHSLIYCHINSGPVSSLPLVILLSWYTSLLYKLSEYLISAGGEFKTCTTWGDHRLTSILGWHIMIITEEKLQSHYIW